MDINIPLGLGATDNNDVDYIAQNTKLQNKKQDQYNRQYSTTRFFFVQMKNYCIVCLFLSCLCASSFYATSIYLKGYLLYFGGNDSFFTHSREENLTLSKQVHVEEVNERACRVVIINLVDFHHEVIESAVLRFPLPFHKYNCSAEKHPIVYDFALYQNRHHLKIGTAASSLSKEAQFLNQTEFWGWNRYFEGHLKGQVFPRNDKYNSRALFNKLVTWDEVDNSIVDAFIDITCDISPKFQTWALSENNYCVLHHANLRINLSQNPSLLSKSCFLSPMWPKEQCQFIASDLPFAKDNVPSLRRETPGIKVCVQGGQRNLTLACEIFSKSKHALYNATLHLSSRESESLVKKINMFGIEGKVVVSSEIDYIKYHEYVSKCDLILPLLEPNESSSHFPWGEKKSSGIIPAIVAYQIDILAHYKYIEIYKKWLSEKINVVTYGDTVAEKVSGLNEQMQRIFEKKVKVSR